MSVTEPSCYLSPPTPATCSISADVWVISLPMMIRMTEEETGIKQGESKLPNREQGSEVAFIEHHCILFVPPSTSLGFTDGNHER